MKKLLVGFLALLAAYLVVNSGRIVKAGVTCTLPFNLQNNTIADATQVMANYNQLVTCLGNAAAAGANSDITSLLGLTTPLVYTAGGSSVYIGGTSTGSANAQVVATPTPISFSLIAGKRIVFVAGFTNTAATTLNVNSTGATNVFRSTPDGPVALTGGEIVLNNLVEAVYDGTRYTLVNSAATVGLGPLTTIASASPTTDLGLASSHNVSISGTASIPSFGSSAVTTYPIYRLKFTGAATLVYNATSMILPSTANITTAANDTATALYLGSGNWQVTSYTPASGAPLVGSAMPCSAVGLSIANNSGTPNTKVDILADNVAMASTAGTIKYASAVSVTVDFTTIGANGIDAGGIANATWYYHYLISNGSTTAGLGSTSATAPTMPAGYTFKCLVGAKLTSGAAIFYRTKQLGAQVQYVATAATNTVGAVSLISGVSGSPTVPTWTAAAWATCAPPTATQLRVFIFFQSSSNSSTIAAPNNQYGSINAAVTSVPPLMGGSNNAGTAPYVGPAIDMVVESSNIYYASSTATSGLSCLGYRDKVNAS